MAQVLISPISNVALAMLVAVFVIVFAVANEALKRMQLFGSMTTPAVALCVTLLSMLGLVRFITLPPTAPPTVTPELVRARSHRLCSISICGLGTGDCPDDVAGQTQ